MSFISVYNMAGDLEDMKDMKDMLRKMAEQMEKILVSVVPCRYGVSYRLTILNCSHGSIWNDM